MKTKILKKLLLPVSFVIIAIGSVTYLVYQSNLKVNDSAKWIDHTEQVIILSEKILSLTKDMESGARGFVITKDSAFLEPVLFAKKDIFKKWQC